METRPSRDQGCRTDILLKVKTQREQFQKLREALENNPYISSVIVPCDKGTKGMGTTSFLLYRDQLIMRGGGFSVEKMCLPKFSY